MKAILLYLAFILSSTNISHAQVNKEYLYDRYWRVETNEIFKPNETVVGYSRSNNQGLFDLGSVASFYNRDGTKKGFNASGKPSFSTWRFIGETKISSGNDINPANIIKLTEKEFIVEVPQIYTSSLTGEKIPVIWKTKYTSFDPCSVYETLRSGQWSDPTLWTCQKIPTAINSVQVNLNHEIVVPDNFVAHAKDLKQNGKLIYGKNAKLELAK